MALSPAQIAQYAQAAGFRGNALTVAVAVAMAESGGNPTVVNSIGAVGLWQILVSAHPQYSTTWLQNPANNAQAAYAISSGGTNWKPWQTYTNGAYLRYMSTASGTPTTQNATVDQVFQAKGLWRWYASPVTNRYDGASEKGQDYSTTWGTPIGIVAGGTVVRTAHFTDSVGDVVEIQAGDGSVWLYQHITSRVRRGQTVSTGDVVGTENGLPVDQHSTGPHIEVRYCPPGRWSASIDSWSEPWVNPASLFARSGSMPATGPGSTTGTSRGLLSFTTPSGTYVPLLDQVHQTLVDTPGFYGIALALDEAEQFPGWIDLTQPLQWDIAGSSLEVPDIPGEIRSIGATITENFLPFAIRSGLVLLGSILLIGLLTKGLGGSLGELAPLLAA